MCGFVHNVAPNLGSTPKVQIPWDVFAHSSQNPHAPTRVTPTTRPNGHPSQRTPDPHAQLLRRGFHSVSRSTPNQSANSSRASQSPPGPQRPAADPSPNVT
jgi:hypothetical protein